MPAIAGIATTLISGLSSVLIQMAFAFTLSAEEFGLFTVGATTLLLAVALSHAVLGQVDLIRGTRQRDPAAINAAFIASLGIAAVGGLGALIGVVLLLQTVTFVGVGLLAASPVVLRDALRFRAFKEGRSVLVLVSDLVALATVAVVIAVGANSLTAANALGVWSLGAVAGFAVAAPVLRFAPSRIGAGFAWLKTHRGIWVPSVLEGLLQSGLPYGLNFLIVAVSGPAALGGYRLGQVLLAVVSNVANGLMLVSTPVLVAAERSARIRRALISNAIGLTVLTMGVALLLAGLPLKSGLELFGDTWLAMRPFFWAVVVHAWVNALAVLNFPMLRHFNRAKFSLFVRIVSVVVIGALAAIAAAQGSVVGIAWAVTVGSTMAYLVRTGVLLVMLRERG